MVAFLNRHVMPLADHEADKHPKVPLNVVLFGHAMAFKCLLRWVPLSSLCALLSHYSTFMSFSVLSASCACET